MAAFPISNSADCARFQKGDEIPRYIIYIKSRPITEPFLPLPHPSQRKSGNDTTLEQVYQPNINAPN